MIKNSDRHERRMEKLKAKREWKERKPRPLNDLVKNSTGLIKWLLLAGGLVYLFLHGNGLTQLLKP